MNLYEIEKSMMNCVDEETGEIIDIEMLEQLQLEREKKIENIACWIKNLESDVVALKVEEEALKSRRRKTESKSEQLRAYLDSILCGEKFETAKVNCFYRTSHAVEVSDDFVEWAQDNDLDCVLTYKQPEPNKKEIKTMILQYGLDFEGKAQVVGKKTLNIK